MKNNIWTRIVKPHQGDDGSIGAYAVHVCSAPGDDWYREYLRKQSDVIVVTSKWDDDAVHAYFPSASEQQVLQDAKGKRSVDGWVARNLADFTAQYAEGDWTPQNAYKFVLQWYFDHKRDPDTRIVKQRTEYLFRFAVGWFECNEPWVLKLVNRHNRFLEKKVYTHP